MPMHLPKPRAPFDRPGRPASRCSGVEP